LQRLCLVITTMGRANARWFSIAATVLGLAAILALPHQARAQERATFAVPILVYHRFGATVADSMTVTTAMFASNLEYLHTHGYTVIRLAKLVGCIRGETACDFPEKSVVITVDDAHRSVFSDMLPLVERYRVPVTLFVYPSAISNASYAMTWEQLRALRETGLFDIQGHTYWHPNFKIEKRRLSPSEYAAFVDMQLSKSRDAIARRLGITVDMIAWPFGIVDDDLCAAAKKNGYIAGFTLQRKPATRGDDPMKLPRYLMTEAARAKAFANLVAEGR
jgi:peptidoglycan/xylan/chitin deacetylase (PgdA/CDA1 family)